MRPLKSLILLTSILTSATATGAEASHDSLAKLLKQRCFQCHDSRDESGAGIDLSSPSTFSIDSGSFDLISEVLDAIDSGAMPPDSEPAIPIQERERFVEALNALARQLKTDPGEIARTPIRRMNRFQYSNAIEDLFDLEVEVFALPEKMMRGYGYYNPSSGKMPATVRVGSRPLGKSQLIGKRLAGVAPFPQDLRAENGYDNRGDHLTLSPLLLESFMKLGRSIVESHDFNNRTCGIWTEFFAPPKATPSSIELSAEIRNRLRPFLRRAFRQPISEELLNRYTRHTLQSIERGDSFTDAMRASASAAITSPRFLYLYDGVSSGTAPEPLTSFELASRLSFFLWGSIPDDGLLDAAESDTLRNDDELTAQVKRMLNDPRSKRFCDSFPAQWLQLERIISSVPDRDLFPEFYFAKFRVSMHMMLEPLLIFETVLIEDRPVLELIDSDFTYRSNLLSLWYTEGRHGKQTPPGAISFNRVPVADRRDGGIVTTAAVMTMTSGPRRTQPITRGAWIATVVFNDPPEPPPADVPPLTEDDKTDTASLSIRERFAIHRKRADCAACHTKIDPLGFVLENYGPTGRWRDKYDNGLQVDSSGTLFRQYEFRNVVDFKDAILRKKDRFARAFASHILAFALGRATGSSDRKAIEEIVRASKTDNYRMRSLIQSVVLSKPFRSKFNPAIDLPQKSELNRRPD